MTIPSGGGLSINRSGRRSDLLLRLAGMAESPATLTKAQVVGTAREAEARATRS
jgi:hypothetical protein